MIRQSWEMKFSCSPVEITLKFTFFADTQGPICCVLMPTDPHVLCWCPSIPMSSSCLWWWLPGSSPFVSFLPPPVSLAHFHSDGSHLCLQNICTQILLLSLGERPKMKEFHNYFICVYMFACHRFCGLCLCLGFMGQFFWWCILRDGLAVWS